MTKPNLKADMKNANKGMRGQNITHAQNQGNRGQQLNPTSKRANPQSQSAKVRKP